MAAFYGNIDTARVLLFNGASVDGPDNIPEDMKRFQTPLHIAIKKWHTDMALFLLSYGADVSRQSLEGAAIHVAIRSGNVGMFNVLLDKGCDVNLKTADWCRMPGQPLYT